MWAKYTDPTGVERAVNGDTTKVRWVPGLNAAAHKLLQNIEHACRTIPGTQEVRRMMRFDTQAHRICYGTPLFVTFSPDENQSM